MSPTPSELLGPAGPIAARLGPTFEPRPEQSRMAESVLAALGDKARLAVEAGTGIGKSFAYLVPAILRCLLHNEKVVIATATISLQEQLIHKDIPLLVETLPQWGLPPDINPASLVPVLAKGRGNYVSLRRLSMASARADSLLDGDESRASLHAIEDWAYTTKDGSLATLPQLSRPDVWDHVRSDTDNCMGRKCPTYKKCFYQESRRALEQANLIICNHALFFADLAIRTRGGGGGGAILPPYDQVILDEAHNAEEIACEHFGLSLSESRVNRLLRTLFSPRRRKGYLVDRALAAGDTTSIERLIDRVQQADTASKHFFGNLYEYGLKSRANAGGTGRIRQSGIIENPLTPAMRELAQRLRLLRESITSEPDRFELQSFARRASEIADCAEAMIAQTLGGTPSTTHPDDEMADGDADAVAPSPYVYWVETGWDDRPMRAAGRVQTPRATLACAPIEIAPILSRCLFSPEAAVKAVPMDEGGGGDEPPAAAPVQPLSKHIGIVLTSATLATRTAAADEHLERAQTAFAHLINNLGLPGDTRTLQLGSPFDYARQASLYIDTSMPNPSAGASNGGGGGDGDSERASGESRSYLDALCSRILHHLQATDGGAFVLFTSMATLNAAAARLEPDLRRLDLPLYVQGRDGPRSLILKNFLDSDRSVLFGAATFWQGVDVRGQRLRNVIITRLPFEPPDRPLTQARLERIETRSGNPFMHDSLPRAVIRFKQGFGRLIRSRSDTGRVVVLDPRIKTKRYGRLFLAALPEGVRVVEAEEPV